MRTRARMRRLRSRWRFCRLWRDVQQHSRRAGVSSRGHGSIAENKSFCETVSDWQAKGHELVLHGYFHDRLESPKRKSSHPFLDPSLHPIAKQSSLTLPPESRPRSTREGPRPFRITRLAHHRLRRARLADGGVAFPNLLAEMGFAYTTRVSEIIPLLPGAKSNQIGRNRFATARARRGGDWPRRVWNKNLYGRLRETESHPSQPPSARS